MPRKAATEMVTMDYKTVAAIDARLLLICSTVRTAAAWGMSLPADVVADEIRGLLRLRAAVLAR